jgi:transcriptional regulator with XRE-family HTH domain
MSKFQNLHAKIKSIRESLGLKQKDFIVEVSKKLGVDPPLSAGLASQWESRRTTPTDVQIAAIAELTKSPWYTMCWFMHDDLPVGRGVDYKQDGSFLLEPQFTDEEIEAAYQQIQAETDAPPEKHLIEWQQAPHRIHELRRRFHEMHQSQEPKDVVVAVSGVTAKVEMGEVTVVTEGNRSALIAKSFSVGDVVKFERKNQKLSLEGEEARSSGEYDFEDDEFAKRYRFDGALRYFLEEDCGLGDVEFGLNRSITSGAIKTKASFYLHNVSVQHFQIKKTTSVNLIPVTIRQKMADLLLIDRMQNRGSKKMVLVSTYEKNLDLKPLEERFAEYIKSAEHLRIKVAFASGPAQAAFKIAELIASHEDPA